MTTNKAIANRGIPRNKKPLQNIIFWITEKESEFYLEWQYEKIYNRRTVKNFSGKVDIDYLKQWLSKNQWMKFRNGDRKFIIQRRIDGNNIPKK